MHERRDRVDNDQHDHCERINTQGPVCRERPGINPCHDLHGLCLAVANAHREKGDPGEQGRNDNQAGCQILNIACAKPVTEQPRDEEADQRKEYDG